MEPMTEHRGDARVAPVSQGNTIVRGRLSGVLQLTTDD